jgi:hypothetical protein
MSGTIGWGPGGHAGRRPSGERQGGALPGRLVTWQVHQDHVRAPCRAGALDQRAAFPRSELMASVLEVKKGGAAQCGRANLNL